MHIGRLHEKMNTADDNINNNRKLSNDDIKSRTNMTTSSAATLEKWTGILESAGPHKSSVLLQLARTQNNLIQEQQGQLAARDREILRLTQANEFLRRKLDRNERRPWLKATTDTLSSSPNLADITTTINTPSKYRPPAPAGETPITNTPIRQKLRGRTHKSSTTSSSTTTTSTKTKSAAGTGGPEGRREEVDNTSRCSVVEIDDYRMYTVTQPQPDDSLFQFIPNSASIQPEEEPVEIPSWRFKTIPSSIRWHDFREPIDDESYARRHLKAEQEEKKLIRRDRKRQREEEMRKRLEESPRYMAYTQRSIMLGPGSSNTVSSSLSSQSNSAAGSASNLTNLTKDGGQGVSMPQLEDIEEIMICDTLPFDEMDDENDDGADATDRNNNTASLKIVRNDSSTATPKKTSNRKGVKRRRKA